MSTSVINPGTTRSAGPSGRFVGLAAAGLAAVIALGFLFASNQGKEVTESEVDLRVSQAASDGWDSRIEFLTEQHLARQASPASRLQRLNVGGAQEMGSEHYQTLIDVYAARLAAEQSYAVPAYIRELIGMDEAPVGIAQQNAFPSDWRKLMDSVEAPIGADTAPNQLTREKRPR